MGKHNNNASPWEKEKNLIEYGKAVLKNSTINYFQKLKYRNAVQISTPRLDQNPPFVEKDFWRQR